jgi:hypothetical protein
MKKTVYLIIFLIGSITTINAAEKKDCSGIKKLSKDYLACKTGNLKAGILNQDGKKWENSGDVTTSKKETDKVSTTKKIKTTASDASDKIKVSAADTTKKIKKSLNNFFKKSKKQYPKGIKK